MSSVRPRSGAVSAPTSLCHRCAVAGRFWTAYRHQEMVARHFFDRDNRSCSNELAHQRSRPWTAVRQEGSMRSKKLRTMRDIAGGVTTLLQLDVHQAVH